MVANNLAALQAVGYNPLNPNAIASTPSPGSIFGSLAGSAQNTAVQPGAPQGQAPAGNSINSILSGASSLTKFNGVKGAIDTFGYNNLGIGTLGAGANGGVAGAASGGSGFAGGDLSSALGGESGSLGQVTGGLSKYLGAAGWGATIGGWIGNGSVGSTIGGALGGIAGAATGITSGIALGSTIGSVVPGLGTVIGAVAGSLIGGMFGGGKPNPASYYGGYGIQADGTLNTEGSWVHAKHVGTDVAKTLQNDFQSYLKKQADKYGVDYTGTNISGIYGGFESASAKKYWTAAPDGTKADGFLMLSNDPNFKKYYYSGMRGRTKDLEPEGTSKYVYFDPNDKDSKQTAYDDAWKYIMASKGIDTTTLVPKNDPSLAANQIRIAKNTGPSTWQTFLDDYKAKQNVQQPSTPTA